jgi:hypothetical protein
MKKEKPSGFVECLEELLVKREKLQRSSPEALGYPNIRKEMVDAENALEFCLFEKIHGKRSGIRLRGGTPPGLKEAILQALAHSDVIMMSAPEAAALMDELMPAIHERLAQDFGAAMLHVTGDEEGRLRTLFEKIVGLRR